MLASVFFLNLDKVMTPQYYSAKKPFIKVFCLLAIPSYSCS
jgi:hypothetical protein